MSPQPAPQPAFAEDCKRELPAGTGRAPTHPAAEREAHSTATDRLRPGLQFLAPEEAEGQGGGKRRSEEQV